MEATVLQKSSLCVRLWCSVFLELAWNTILWLGVVFTEQRIDLNAYYGTSVRNENALVFLAVELDIKE